MPAQPRAPEGIRTPNLLIRSQMRLRSVVTRSGVPFRARLVRRGCPAYPPVRTVSRSIDHGEKTARTLACRNNVGCAGQVPNIRAPSEHHEIHMYAALRPPTRTSSSAWVSHPWAVDRLDAGSHTDPARDGHAQRPGGSRNIGRAQHAPRRHRAALPHPAGQTSGTDHELTPVRQPAEGGTHRRSSSAPLHPTPCVQGAPDTAGSARRIRDSGTHPPGELRVTRVPTAPGQDLRGSRSGRRPSRTPGGSRGRAAPGPTR